MRLTAGLYMCVCRGAGAKACSHNGFRDHVRQLWEHVTWGQLIKGISGWLPVL